MVDGIPGDGPEEVSRQNSEKKSQREVRYFIVKVKDAKRYLTEDELLTLEELGRKVQIRRQEEGRGQLFGVVVESDWPEYEKVWAMIESRVTGKPTQDEYGQRDFPLPDWAERFSNGGYFEEGAQLRTRDGRKIGNAVVSEIVYDPERSEKVATVVTDVGTVVHLSKDGLEDLFYPPVYVMAEKLMPARGFLCRNATSKSIGKYSGWVFMPAKSAMEAAIQYRDFIRQTGAACFQVEVKARPRVPTSKSEVISV
ncbi:MAG TPA: hypothetical protein ENJ30_12575 [Desulfobulbaceae bacterium]|nr:hypothetical protein [Desulfobulbaceae bacterium]